MSPIPRTPLFLQQHHENSAEIRAELGAGLDLNPATIAPKFFYDPLGARLFEAITELPEYYLLRSEAAILADRGEEIARATGNGMTLIDLGAGNCAKAANLFPRLQPAQYVAVDISVDFLKSSLFDLQHRFPSLPMIGLGHDFAAGIELPAAVRAEHRVFFYPGSSLGNFTPGEARAFLRRLRRVCDPQGGLLLGIDLVKDKSVLEAAYDDALGVTAAFNRNLLLRVNALLGSDFDPAAWQHVAFFNPLDARIEMHLEARSDIRVSWPGGERRFRRGERIHTENSYKYSLEQISVLVSEAGFPAPRIWTDERGWFAVCYAAAA